MKNKDSKMYILCPDGHYPIEAELICAYSRMARGLYEDGGHYMGGESKMEIINKVEEFCRGCEKYADDDLVQFYSEFRQTNQEFALDLIQAAFQYEIISLIKLLLEDVNDIFTKMSTTEEAYKILYVNLENCPSKFEVMKEDLEDCGWAMEGLFY